MEQTNLKFIDDHVPMESRFRYFVKGSEGVDWVGFVDRPLVVDHNAWSVEKTHNLEEKYQRPFLCFVNRQEVLQKQLIIFDKKFDTLISELPTTLVLIDRKEIK